MNTIMNLNVIIRLILALLLSLGLAFHGYKKKSLDISGCIAAVIVGFISFATSYRYGLILILFYYTSSKLTKVKEDVKAKLESNYMLGGQRNWVQVFANSILATIIGLIYMIYIGEEIHISYNKHDTSKSLLSSFLSTMYVAHYSCASADTWASEVGILSKTKPRLVTSLFLRIVPHGTNGGMTPLGTIFSGLGGTFIGLIYYTFSIFIDKKINSKQYPMIIVGLICGVLGSLFDSILGATLQASYYSKDKKCIVKTKEEIKNDSSVVKICGVDILSNEAVNFVSIALTMIVSIYISPKVFCFFDSNQCI